MIGYKTCERCGGALPPAGVLGDRCPRCMVEVALDSTAGLNDPEVTLAVRTDTSDVRTAAIGRYKLLRLIGEGGMGAVYEAEQEHPRRTVALKIIKAGMTNAESRRRFEQEAEALGRLQHPGIAQIYEAGTADTGFGPQPYFAMELIRGRAPRQYVQEQNSSVRDRLELVARIADAVHHAHQRGLIHRDLKPSNILIDDTGQPKVLDFGVSRITDDSARSTVQTDVGQLVGTLAYMSPEQVSGDPLEIDTRSDVYALGMILYELLAGRHPYDTGKKLHEAIEAIREIDPPRLGAVNRTYRGDIETIAVKALEKDKTRRYSSAAELASDIHRYLKDEPIIARPPSASYQLQKFARRHRAIVASAAAVLAVLIAGVVTSTSQANLARRERDRATAAEETARRQRDFALSAEQQATHERNRAVAAEEQSRLQRDNAIAEKWRADGQAATVREQYLLNIWKSLSHESIRDSSNQLDGDRAALLARQAMLMHALTPDQAQYLVEDALQQAVRQTEWSHKVSGAWSVAFSSDGVHMASGATDATVRVWDLRKPGAARVLWGHRAPVHAVAFSRDGSLLASGSGDGTVRVWDTRNLDAAPVLLEGHAGVVASVAFSPDGSRLASGDYDKTVRLWDLRDPRTAPVLLDRHQGDQGISPISVAFSSDGSYLASGGDTVRVWDVRSSGSTPVLVTGPWADLNARARSVAGGSQLTRRVNAIAFSPDGSRLAVGLPDAIVRIWELRHPAAAPVQLKGHQWDVVSLSFSSDGTRLAASGLDSTVRIWDVRNPDAAPLVLREARGSRSVAFSPDGLRLASASPETMRLWDLTSGTPFAVFKALPGELPAVLSSNGRWLVTRNARVLVRDLRTPAAPPVHIRTAALGSYSVLSSDGRRLASADSRVGLILVWDVERADAPALQLKGHQEGVLSLVLSGDGSLLASEMLDRTVQIWSLRNPRTPPVVVPLDGPQVIRSMAFSPDGSRLVFSRRDFLQLVDLRDTDAGPVTVLGSGERIVATAMAFAPDGSRLATGDDVSQSVRVFDMRNVGAAPLLLTGGHKSAVRSVAFSLDGLRLASAGADRTVRIWDLRKPEALPVVLDVPEEPASGVAFSPDGTQLLAMNRRNIHAWPLWSAAADYLCTRVWRNLSFEEWRLYVGADIPYQRTCPSLPL